MIEGTVVRMMMVSSPLQSHLPEKMLLYSDRIFETSFYSVKMNEKMESKQEISSRVCL